MATTPRLDNLAAMQNRPLGTNTALYRDPSTLAVGRQYKQQKSDYDMARRLLRRQARRGDARAATGLIDLGKDAAANNVEFGMQNVEQRDAAIAGRTAGMQQEVVDMQNTSAMNRGVATSDLLAPSEQSDLEKRKAFASGVTQPQYKSSTGNVTTMQGDGVAYLTDSKGNIGRDSRTGEVSKPFNLKDAQLSATPAPAPATESASVWNTMPTTKLGTRAYEELGSTMGGKNVKFRQGLDRALGMAKTDAERNELGLVAKEAGISDEAFKRRTDWWNKKRR